MMLQRILVREFAKDIVIIYLGRDLVSKLDVSPSARKTLLFVQQCTPLLDKLLNGTEPVEYFPVCKPAFIDRLILKAALKWGNISCVAETDTDTRSSK